MNCNKNTIKVENKYVIIRKAYIFITMNKINLTVVAIVATLGVLTAAPAAMNNGAILPQAQASTRRIVYINRQLSLQIV
jgi:hypothetical protein